MNYDIPLFLEIVESVDGIKYLREDSFEGEGVSCKFYQGLKGNLVMIDTSDEYASVNTYKGYLISLGLAHLIDSMFPAEEPCQPAEDVNKILEELRLDSDERSGL